MWGPPSPERGQEAEAQSWLLPLSPSPSSLPAPSTLPLLAFKALDIRDPDPSPGR